MLARWGILGARSFKSWTQYLAERSSVTEQELLEARRLHNAGAYDEWREQTIAEGRINFILDHVPAAEQASLLKEFTAKDLAKYVLNHIRDLDEASLKKISSIPVRHHVWGGLNSLIAFKHSLTTGAMLANEDVLPKNRLANVAKAQLVEKLKELSWKQADAEVEKSNQEVAKV